MRVTERTDNFAPDHDLEFSLDDVAALNPDPTPAPTPNRHDELLSAALAYTARDICIIPLHEPRFDDAGKLTGCTCEQYKRSKKYFEWLRSKGLEKKFDPNYTCRTPGKHPRLSDWENQASKDPQQIRAWWDKWPTANVGGAMGKSGLITFDVDNYKEIYGDNDLFTQEDKRTPTQISGKGGEHLFYAMPEGRHYTNANNTLPPGIDIRGEGGMIVLAPSIHPCGRLYEWEEGYSIFERTPRPLPQKLVDILDAAHAKHTTAKAVQFTTPTTERPDLIRWKISKEVRELINNPAPVGQRSEADMKVATSLCFAGASDDEIKSVFDHFPIGAQGKFAEAGQQYLAVTIGKARAFVEQHPRPDVDATIAHMHLWIKTHNLADCLPHGPGSKKVRPVTDAVFDAMQAEGGLSVTIGKKRLAKLAGVSPTTVVNVLALLNGRLFNVTPTEFGSTIELPAASLVVDCRFSKYDPLLSSCTTVYVGGGQKIEIDKNAYSPHKADEAFLTGTSRYMKQHIQDLAQELEITPAQAKADYTFAGLGEGLLLAYDTSLRIGTMTAPEYAEETGIKLSAARSHLRRAEKMGFAESAREGSHGPKLYSFSSDFWEKIDELAPNLRTYKLSDQREDKRLEAAQQWAKSEQAQAATPEEAQKLERRFAKLAKERLPHLENLYADKGLSQDELISLAYEVADYKRSPQTAATLRTQRNAQRDEHRETVALIRDLADSIADIGTPLENVFDEVMKYGVFDAQMVRKVLQSAVQMATYETIEDVRRRMFVEDMKLPAPTISTAATNRHHQMALGGAA
jgi:predicted ArsR family transcriptional regulator